MRRLCTCSACRCNRRPSSHMRRKRPSTAAVMTPTTQRRQRPRSRSFSASLKRRRPALSRREPEAAEAALWRARELISGDYGALATTRRQLRLLIAFTHDPPELIEPLSGPGVLHFCGHRLRARFPAEDIEPVAARIAAELERIAPGFGYGALASGADILCAEELLRRGAELHVVLPFDRDAFIRASVADAGDQWIARFDACMAAAESVTYATDDALEGEDVLFRYGTELAMGMALQRATWLDAPAAQLAILGGEQADQAAGTAVDVRTWSATGNPATVLRPPNAARPEPGSTRPEGVRLVRSLIFADVRKFSTLTDEQLPRFTKVVLSELSRVLREYEGEVE